MLNLLKKTKIKKTLVNSLKNKPKHSPSSVREWNNSIYVFNRNNFKLIPTTSLLATRLIKSFFDLYNKNLEKIVRSKRLLLRLRRLSSNKIFISKAEYKHTNNNVIINIYMFNRQIHNYLSKLKNIYLKKFLTKKNINVNLVNVLKLISEKSSYYLREINKNKYLFIKTLDIIEKNKNYKTYSFRNLSDYTTNFYKKILRLNMKKLRLYFLYKQLVYINKSKFSYTYLRLLKKHLENLYNKNVEFNFINLNRFYLNSDILFESIKLKLTRNKRKMRKILNTIKSKVKISNKNSISVDAFDNQLNEIYDNKTLKHKAIHNLKYKHVTGFRLETRGRLSKRYTASRSIFKLKYKGNLLDMGYPGENLSSVMLKGNLKSNLQYTKLSSKTRIGSFGIKGWVSGN